MRRDWPLLAEASSPLLDSAKFVEKARGLPEPELLVQFAQQHGIASDVLDYETVFVESEWYELLDAMCYACFTERWPELIERARGW